MKEKARQYEELHIELFKVADVVSTSGPFEGGDHEFPTPTAFEL